MPTPPGQRDASGLRITRHALERFAERFGNPDEGPDHPGAEDRLRQILSRTRRLGRNPENDAVALLALAGRRPLVAIVQDRACLTVLTWPQFEPRLPEFGRKRLPRKRGRFLRRLEAEHPGDDAPDEPPRGDGETN